MGRTDPEVMRALRAKLAKPGAAPVSPQAVQQRRAKLQRLVPMAPDMATYVVAQREGVPLHRYLDEATLDQVAVQEQRVATKEGGAGNAAASAALPQKRATSRPAVVKELKLSTITVKPEALSPGRIDQARKMGDVYPMLYVFENSLREFVDGHLTASVGKDWWDEPNLVSRKVRRTVEHNKAAEGLLRYHSSRKARPIYYTNLADIETIATSETGWKVFKPLLPSYKWLGAMVERIEASRNVVAHMNPLEERDITRIKLDLEDWFAQIKEHAPPTAP